MEEKDRYEIRKIEENYFGIYDKVAQEIIFDSTAHGITFYAKIFGLDYKEELQ